MMMMFCGDTYLGGDDHVDSCGVVDDDSQLNEHNQIITTKMLMMIVSYQKT